MFKKVFESAGNDVTAVFDGTQVITKAAGHGYDLVILSRSIPSVDSSNLVEMMHKSCVPVILLLRGSINSELLLDQAVANSHISFPFYPDDLLRLVDEVMEKLHTPEKIRFEDAELSVSDFELSGGVRVTNEEINIIRTLTAHEPIYAGRSEPYISALNNKLERLNKKTRIRYIMKEGYRLVTNYE